MADGPRGGVQDSCLWGGRQLSISSGLIEIEHIADISSRLVVNRAGLKTRPEVMGGWVQRIREAVNGD